MVKSPKSKCRGERQKVNEGRGMREQVQGKTKSSVGHKPPIVTRVGECKDPKEGLSQRGVYDAWVE